MLIWWTDPSSSLILQDIFNLVDRLIFYVYPSIRPVLSTSEHSYASEHLSQDKKLSCSEYCGTCLVPRGGLW